MLFAACPVQLCRACGRRGAACGPGPCCQSPPPPGVLGLRLCCGHLPGDRPRPGRGVGLWVALALVGPMAGRGCGHLGMGPAVPWLGQGLTALGAGVGPWAMEEPWGQSGTDGDSPGWRCRQDSGTQASVTSGTGLPVSRACFRIPSYKSLSSCMSLKALGDKRGKFGLAGRALGLENRL